MITIIPMMTTCDTPASLNAFTRQKTAPINVNVPMYQCNPGSVLFSKFPTGTHHTTDVRNAHIAITIFMTALSIDWNMLKMKIINIPIAIEMLKNICVLYFLALVSLSFSVGPNTTDNGIDNSVNTDNRGIILYLWHRI